MFGVAAARERRCSMSALGLEMAAAARWESGSDGGGMNNAGGLALAASG